MEQRFPESHSLKLYFQVDFLGGVFPVNTQCVTLREKKIKLASFKNLTENMVSELQITIYYRNRIQTCICKYSLCRNESKLRNLYLLEEIIRKIGIKREECCLPSPPKRQQKCIIFLICCKRAEKIGQRWNWRDKRVGRALEWSSIAAPCIIEFLSWQYWPLFSVWLRNRLTSLQGPWSWWYGPPMK